MSVLWAVAAAVIGYVAGSLSGARLVGRLVAPGRDLSRTEIDIDAETSVVVRGVSPSTLTARAGWRAGLTAAAIDISKAVAATLLVRIVFPDHSHAAYAAAGAVLGHVFPIYHRFLGGFGISPMVGGLLVLDWLAIPATTVVAYVIGVIVADSLVSYESWPALLIPWFIWRGPPEMVLYAVVVNAVYWPAMRVEARAHWRSRRADRRPWRERVRDLQRTGPGEGMRPAAEDEGRG